MERFIFGTHNSHKLKEIRELAGDAFGFFSLDDIGFHEEVPETAETLAGNALQKARYIHERTGDNCFADDTGLEIDFLGGRPGVYSARYAGPGHDHEKNIQKVLHEMGDTDDRSARFRTVIALILRGEEYLFEGKVEGVILKDKRGSEGFGYDPIFMPDGYNRSFAQMSLDEKNRISHRGRATRRLIKFLEEWKSKNDDASI